MIVRHKGYEAKQTVFGKPGDGCYQVMILKNGRMLLHALWDKKLTADELKKEIENYIELRGMRL